MSDHRVFADRLFSTQPACPPGLTTWNQSDPGRRFAVYRNNVMVSLIDALADTFPVVQQLVGEVFFRAMAGVFARQSPPRSSMVLHQVAPPKSSTAAPISKALRTPATSMQPASRLLASPTGTR